MKSILFLVGSLRAESLNRRLARVAATNLPDGYEAAFFDLNDVPFYNEDLKGHAPESVLALRESIRSADGVFWTTPEYNYALPGIVKNVIDWTTRPMLPQHPIVGKPMNAAVATNSATNGIRSLSDLKRIWANCGGVPVTTFDFVLQLAQSKFIEQDGIETIEPTSMGVLRFAIDSLARAIEGEAGAVAVANWTARFGAA
jgi:NAD(P)H-dependent FMN reductase